MRSGLTCAARLRSSPRSRQSLLQAGEDFGRRLKHRLEPGFVDLWQCPAQVFDRLPAIASTSSGCDGADRFPSNPAVCVSFVSASITVPVQTPPAGRQPGRRRQWRRTTLGLLDADSIETVRCPVLREQDTNTLPESPRISPSFHASVPALECAWLRETQPALASALNDFSKLLERAKGFEPSTPTLARLCSTPELHPHP
jgi:hypothetical protein